jgi:hypothetical protein
MESVEVLINMFKFGYKFYVIRRNNAIPFAHGGISASIRSEQPNEQAVTKPFIVSACTISL